MRLVAHLRARPRLALSIVAGVSAALLLPAPLRAVTRALLGWNVAVWLYLLLIGVMMARADHAHLRRVALVEAEGMATVLALVSAAAVASLVGIVTELAAAKQPGAHHALPHLAFALATVAGAWLLLPVSFALSYASTYFRATHGSGLQFPGADDSFKPGFADFLYFSFTIAVAAQTADVSVSSTEMRRLVLLQALLSFVFNTAILALTINIAAGMF